MEIDGPFKFLCTSTTYVHGRTFKVPVNDNLCKMSQESPHVARAFIKKDEKENYNVVLEIKEVDHLPTYLDQPDIVHCNGYKCRIKSKGCWCVDCFGDEPDLDSLLQANADMDVQVIEDEVLKTEEKVISTLTKKDMEKEMAYIQSLLDSYTTLLKKK